MKLADFVKRMNPRMVNGPPSLADSGICYLGSRGEVLLEKVVFCKDLPFDMIGSVGSW